MIKPHCRTLGLCALLAGICLATPESPASTFTPAGADASGYDAGLGVDPIYSTPTLYEETGYRSPGFIPNEAYVEYLGNMSYNGGHGRVHVTNAVLSLPLISPARAAWRGWHLDLRGSARLTLLDSDGCHLLDEGKLYTLGLQAGIARSIGRSSRLQLGFIPQFSTDFDHMTHHNLYTGAYAAFARRAGDTLRYTIGLAYMPDYYRSFVLPVLSLQWRYAPAWELRVEGMRLSATCVADERFHWGPFFQWNTAAWTVQREQKTQQFRMNNGILGIGATYSTSLAGGGSLSILGDLGGTFNNVFRVRDVNGKHTREKYRAHPGLYARVGLRLAF